MAWIPSTPRANLHGREVRAKFYDMAKELGDLGAWVRMHYVWAPIPMSMM